MILAPHVVIETIQSIGMRDALWRAPKSLPGLLALLRQAVLFDFGVIHPDMEHKDFALDLYERKLFQLPYPVTAFAFQARPHNNGWSKDQPVGGGMMLVHQDDDMALSAVMCSERRTPDGRAMGGIPIGVIMKAKLANPKDGTVDVTEATYPIMSDRIMAMMYGDADETGHALMVQRLCSNLVSCMGMTVMLMSKGVEAEHTPAPDRLNKGRKIRGKPPIGERYTVKLSLGDLRTITTAAGDESIAGHSRGSPRLHWRRGHFRTIYRGTEAERVVPVAPSLIGANDKGQAIARKGYAVKL